MSNQQLILGVYDSPATLNDTVSSLRSKGHNIVDIYSPFPIHGIEKALGLKRSRLTVLAFFCGVVGCILGFSLIYYTDFYDWPMNIGGKPNDRVTLNFIPVTFEATILVTAFGMATLFFARAKMFPGVIEDLHDLRQSDDLFIIAVDTTHSAGAAKEEIKQAFIKSGANEVREKTVEQ